MGTVIEQDNKALGYIQTLRQKSPRAAAFIKRSLVWSSSMVGVIQFQSGGPDFGKGKCGNGKTARE